MSEAEAKACRELHEITRRLRAEGNNVEVIDLELHECAGRDGNGNPLPDYVEMRAWVNGVKRDYQVFVEVAA